MQLLSICKTKLLLIEFYKNKIQVLYFFLTFSTFLQMAFINPITQINNGDVDFLRKSYLKALESCEENDFLLNLLEKNTNKTPLFLAYQGACEGLKAKYAFNPYKKIEYLRKSQKSLSKAISQESTDIEIRFLRFSIQHNSPAFLGISTNLDEDRTIIVANISQAKKNIGKETLKMIVEFLIKSKRCKTEEIATLKMAIDN
jgi:hypothetical protein